jgi:hypothetical protein
MKTIRRIISLIRETMEAGRNDSEMSYLAVLDRQARVDSFLMDLMLAIGGCYAVIAIGAILIIILAAVGVLK